MAGIYVHIPFCKSKCRYCDFTSFPEKLGFAEGYMACVYRELALREEELKDYVFNTVYIGGGTPSVIDENYIAMLMAGIKRHFKVSADAEVTIEMNPGTVTAEKVALYKKCGINRFSVGLQSAVDSQLEELGRCHNLDDFLACAALLKGENFSADIMIGLKDQSLEDIKKSIKVAAEAGAQHISMYALTAEDGTPIYTDYLNGELPDGDEVAAMYAYGVKVLKELGFDRYEVSNFCKKGRESRHNLNYWQRGEYVGFGVAASSHIRNVRLTNTFDLDEYYKCILSGKIPVIDREEVDEEGRREETLMLALRTARGLDIKKFEKEFNCSFDECFKQALKKNERYLERVEGRIKIKDEYLFVQNTIICDFLS